MQFDSAWSEHILYSEAVEKFVLFPVGFSKVSTLLQYKKWL